jgi:hypothetical protein
MATGMDGRICEDTLAVAPPDAPKTGDDRESAWLLPPYVTMGRATTTPPPPTPPLLPKIAAPGGVG